MRQAADPGHYQNPDCQPDDLRQGLLKAQAFLQLRNQVCQRHVDKTAAGDHQKVRQIVLQLLDQIDLFFRLLPPKLAFI